MHRSASPAFMASNRVTIPAKRNFGPKSPATKSLARRRRLRTAVRRYWDKKMPGTQGGVPGEAGARWDMRVEHSSPGRKTRRIKVWFASDKMGKFRSTDPKIGADNMGEWNVGYFHAPI